MKDRSCKKEFIVYRVSHWTLYFFNDPKAELIEPGLTYWEASMRCNELQKLSGEPFHLLRYKVCHIDDWNQQIKFV
jgi:hypothetical protein